jgi:predicted amidohydrolase YtcJ
MDILVLCNARIYTLDPDKPVVSALAINRSSPVYAYAGQVIATGTDEELQQEFKGRARIRDMAGQIILPGLTDAHIHLKQYAQSLQKVDCETPTQALCLARIVERARITPPGEWILGHGWTQAEWPEGYGTAAALDKAAPHNPVYLTAKSLHAAWANTRALQTAGLTNATPNPADGRLGRDSGGRLDGLLFEGAMRLVADAIPPSTPKQVVEAIRQAFPNLWALGLTAIHDFDRRQCFSALQTLHDQGELALRVVKSIPVEDLEHAIALGLRTGFGDDLLRIGAIKAFADGALGPRTAAMLQAYSGEPDNLGMLLLDRETLFEYGREATKNGLTMAVHAIGDRANHEVITAYSQIRAFETEQGYPSRRHRIEHVQVYHPADLDTLSNLDVVASMQPIHAPSDMVAAERFWGKRTEHAYAWRTLLDRGLTLAFGSDAPVESPNPFWGIHAAVTRRRPDGSPGPEGWHPEQRLTVQEALTAYTSGPAYLAGQEARSGHLAPGSLADLIVLDSDPFTCEPEALKNMQPQATMLGGEWVYHSA